MSWWQAVLLLGILLQALGHQLSVSLIKGIIIPPISSLPSLEWVLGQVIDWPNWINYVLGSLECSVSAQARSVLGFCCVSRSLKR